MIKLIIDKVGIALFLSLLPFTRLAAQSVDSTDQNDNQKTRLQHTACAGMGPNLYLMYDVRFRTPNKLTDFYAAAGISTVARVPIASLEGGALFGNSHDVSFNVGLSAFNAVTISFVGLPDPLIQNGYYLGLPIGLRSQSDSRGIFIQGSYMAAINLTNSGRPTLFTPQLKIGYTFGKKRTPAIDESPAVGFQQAVFSQIGAYVVFGLGYDLRYRTNLPWLSFAAQGAFSGTNSFLGNAQVSSDINRNSKATGQASLSALFGTPVIAFEFGARGALYQSRWERVGFVDYKTGEKTIVANEDVNQAIGVLAGFRYQPPQGGILFFTNLFLASGQSLTIDYRPLLYVDLTVGLGYSFGTIQKK